MKYRIIHVSGERKVKQIDSEVLELLAGTHSFKIEVLDQNISIKKKEKEPTIMWIMRDEKEKKISDSYKELDVKKTYSITIEEPMCGYTIYQLLATAKGANINPTSILFRGVCQPKILDINYTLDDDKQAILINIQAVGVSGQMLYGELKLDTEVLYSKSICMDGKIIFKFKLNSVSWYKLNTHVDSLKIITCIKDAQRNSILDIDQQSIQRKRYE